MKANLSLYNAIFNIWMFSVHPSRQISVASVGSWTISRQLFSCLALKTIPFCCKIVVTFFPSWKVHASIRCIKSGVARTFRSNCRRKALDFLRLFGDGYFKESGVWLWLILPDLDTKIMKESFHRKSGQRQDLHFNLVCRLSRKLISAARISLLFICTDCQRDFMRTKLLSMFHMKAISVSRHHRKSSCFDISFCALIPILGSGFIVWTITSLFLIDRCFPMEHSFPHFLLKTQSFYGLTLNGTHKY